ncbi:9054_t:CDS:2, partial [Gigaspora margarita]
SDYAEWNHDILEDLKSWWKILRARRVSELESQKKKEIEESIEKRCQMIEDKQGVMLTSLLDRNFRKVKLDRLLEVENNRKKLIIKSSKAGIYEPKKSIDESWYLNLTNNVTEEEWNEMLAGGDWLYEEKDSKVIKFLGVWVDNRLNEKQIKEKAKSLVRVTAVYMLQTSKLSKRTIDSIQSPIISLAKRKMGIAKMLLNKQITSLHVRVNTEGPEELVTKIRIRQGFQLMGVTVNDWHQNRSSIHINLWKNNLACLVMLRAKELQITFEFNNEEEEKNINSTKVVEILGGKFTFKTAMVFKNLNVRSIYQLINKEGKEMITWQQLKMLRRKPIKGRPAKWFIELEEIMLVNNSSRKLKQEFLISNGNREFLLTVLDKVSNDNRKREWIVTKQPKKKELSNALIGKAVISTRRKVLTEHWKLNIFDNEYKQTLEKCKSYKIDQFGELNTCKNDMIVGLGKEDSSEVGLSESTAETLTMKELDMVLIEKQRLSQTIKDELTKRYRKNCAENRKVLTFYTDGSLRKTARDNSLKEDSIGADPDRIILKPPPCLNVSLRWQESQIEDSTRKFIKNIMDLKVSTEWSFIATIKKLEPAEEKVKNYDWSKLGKILWGVTEEEKILRRAEIIKGLTQEKMKRQLYNQLQSSKKARKLLEVFVNTVWNGFFTEIWKKHCEKVITWEKSRGIRKRKGGFVMKPNHGNNDSKKDDRDKVQKTWSDTVVGYII